MRKVIALALSLVCFATFAYAADAPAAPAKKIGGEVGEYIKPFSLKAVDGSGVEVKSDALKKKAIFMMVSSVCTACRTELAEMAENLKEFDGKADVYLVVIDMDAKVGYDRIKLNTPKLPFVAVGDSSYEIGGRVNLVSAPSTLILDVDGKILAKKGGYVGGQWKEYARLVSK